MPLLLLGLLLVLRAAAAKPVPSLGPGRGSWDLEQPGPSRAKSASRSLRRTGQSRVTLSLR